MNQSYKNTHTGRHASPTITSGVRFESPTITDKDHRPARAYSSVVSPQTVRFESPTVTDKVPKQAIHAPTVRFGSPITTTQNTGSRQNVVLSPREFSRQFAASSEGGFSMVSFFRGLFCLAFMANVCVKVMEKWIYLLYVSLYVCMDVCTLDVPCR